MINYSVRTPSELWRALVEGVDHVSTKPPLARANGGHRFPGGYLAEPCHLDGAFFGLRPSEVKHLAANQVTMIVLFIHSFVHAHTFSDLNS